MSSSLVSCHLPALDQPGIAVIPWSVREGAIEDERHDSIRGARRKQRARWSALREAHHDRPLAAGGVKHVADVLHALLERGNVGDRVRAARSGLVVGDHAGDRSQPGEEPRVARIRPQEVEVRDEAGRVEQVDRARAPDLVGDADPVRPHRVAGIRLLHGSTLPRAAASA